jgi:hypothetical protein
MQEHSNHTTALLGTGSSASMESMTGIVQRVDLVQREITVIVGTKRFQVDVPPQCLVMLRGERIKLRIIQPGDVVRISLVRRADRSAAQRVEVAPVNSLPATGEN